MTFIFSATLWRFLLADNRSKELRSRTMSRIRSKDTKSEILLRHALWTKGMRYRKNDRSIIGTPDIVFKKKKIAIFCDSEFWHGKLYLEGKNIPENNQEFWIEKFERNLQRDKKVNSYLSDQGWTVLRYWENDIYNNLEDIVNEIQRFFENTT